MDARGILEFLDAVEESSVIQPHSLTMLRHGHVVAAGWWAPHRPGQPYLLYSMSKSFTSTALGLAVDEGLLRLDDRVVGFFPEFTVDDPAIRSMRVRDLAAMSTGHLTDTWDAVLEADPEEPVRGFLRLPPDRDPGTVFAYNQSATYTLGTILQRLTGRTLTEYLRPRLFDPIGVGFASWQQHPAGRDLGFSGLYVPSEAIARLGELYLRRGVWNGRRILPEYWVTEATRSHVSTAEDHNPDWQQGYGFQFWRSRHGYRADGAYGQFCLVLPDHDAVVAYTGATIDMQAVLDLAWQHLLPAFDHRSTDSTGSTDEQLARRLATLSLPAVPVGPAPSGDARPRAFTPAGGRCAAQPSLTGIEVDQDGSGVVLWEADAALRLALGRGEWAVSEPNAEAGEAAAPVAVSGGWLDATTMRFDALFLATPHRLQITCDHGSGTFQAAWITAPLGSPRLANLRPRSRP